MICIYTRKLTQNSNTKHDACATALIELPVVYVDLAGPVDFAFREDFEYCLAFKDDISGTGFVYFLSNNNDSGCTEIFLTESTLMVRRNVRSHGSET